MAESSDSAICYVLYDLVPFYFLPFKNSVRRYLIP